jgi:phosphatidylglycerol:prolipoprotein diacylglycerol transferase
MLRVRILRRVTLLAESLVHTMDPFVFRVTDTFGPRWYGMSYALGFVVAWLILRWLARTGRTPLRPELVGDFITWCIVGVVVGGRLGHVLLYERDILWTFSSSFPFWEVLAIHRGGMSSHGGITGVIIACAVFARRNGIAPAAMVDTAAFITPAGLMFGRLANWVNGELWGKVLPAAMQASPPWWSVKYPREAIDLAGSAASRGQAEHLVTMAYAGDPRAVAEVAALVPARYPNNFIQAFTDGPMLMLVLVLVWWKPRRAGTLSGAFLVGYGVLRFCSEQYREPDSAILFGVPPLGDVTSPILVSMLMVVIGAAVIALRPRGSQLIGGVRPRPE